MKLYGELADWFQLLTSPDDYAEEAALYDREIRAALKGPAKTMLELGSGGGNNASHLRASWKLTLSDVSEGMLKVSRVLNPDCEHIAGDMRTLRLGRTFDAVFIHDAITYMTTLGDVTRALETAFVHTRPGGVVLVSPDETRETYRPRTESGGHDDASRGLRYLAWSYDPDPSDTTTVIDFAYLLRDLEEGGVRVEHDRHVVGLFWRREWLDALLRVGFREVTTFTATYADPEPATNEIFVGVRPEPQRPS